MRPEISQLLQLQQRDQLIRQLQKDLNDVPKMKAAAEMKLAGDKAAVAKAKEGVQQIEVKIKEVELDVKTRETSIKRLQDQQFETRKNDEFAALGHEIQRYEGEVSDLETKELELMEQLDAAKAALASAQSRLQDSETRVAADIATLDQRATVLQERLTATQAERAELASPVPEETLELYDRLFSKKGDAAVSPMENGSCGGCHMKGVMSTVQQLRQDEHLVQCDNCGRILYLVE